MTTNFDELPDDVELLVEQHNKNHDRVDRLKSYNHIREAQIENRAIRNKLVQVLDVPRSKVNELVDDNVPPQKFRREVEGVLSQ